MPSSGETATPWARPRLRRELNVTGDTIYKGCQILLLMIPAFEPRYLLGQQRNLFTKEIPSLFLRRLFINATYAPVDIKELSCQH